MQYMVDTVALKKLMVERGYDSATDISKDMKVSRNTVGSVLKGESYPSSKVISRFIEVLQIPLELVGSIFFVKKLA